MGRNKIVTAAEAVAAIPTGAVVATGGFVGSGFAEEVAVALEKRFLESGQPRDLTLIYAAGQGDGKDRGLNHLAHEGLVKRVIGGHWGLAPKMGKLALDNKIEAYNLPQGCVAHLFRAIAGKRPGHITHIGLMTFVDPRYGGGKMNDRTKEDMVEILRLDGKDYLWYKTMPVNAAIIRGTSADSFGNVSMEKEALHLENLAIAQAANNSGGIVIVQVERIVERGSLNPRHVVIPGILVDSIVVAEPANHHQTFSVPYNPAYSGEIRVPRASIKPLPLDERKIIARRAAFELRPGTVVSLGIGMPEGVAIVASEEGILDHFTLTVEPGAIGGVPAGGLSFGAVSNMECLIDQPSQFDFYDGGGLDLAFLGLAQADQHGNLNVSKFGPRFAGAGGFINITQTAKRLFFLGTFSAGGLEIEVADGKLRIIKEGETRKFLKEVDHRTFSGEYAMERGQPVMFITERAVFELSPKGLVLTEIAPGIDVKTQVLDLMDFTPIVSPTVKEMDARLFTKDLVGLQHMFDNAETKVR